MPEGVDDNALRQALLNRYGIEILGGFGPLTCKILRFGLMGASSTRNNVLLFLDALESAMAKQGCPLGVGGTQAAERVYTDKR